MPIRIDLGDEVIEVGDDPALDMSEVEFVYVTMADERVRPEHAALHGTVWSGDDRNAPIPPLGYNCRCKAEWRRKGKTDTIPASPKNPPEPGEEALKKFWKEAKNTQTGEKVTPRDTFGEKAGKVIEEGKVSADEAIDPETGEARPSTDVELIAKGNTRKVLAGLAILSTLAITPAMRQRIIKRARELTGSDEERLIKAILEIRPSVITTRSQAKRLAKAILQVTAL